MKLAMSEESKGLQEMIEAFEERMRKRHEAEEAAEKAKADKLRLEYLKRTGRMEMKP